MKQSILLAGALVAAYCLAGSGPAAAKDDWEWWFTTPVSYRPTPEIRLNVEGLFRWKNDLKDIYYRSAITGGTYSLLPGIAVGGHFWYKEVRKDKDSPWVYTDTYVGNLDFQYQAADWLVLRENNRIEYDNTRYKWTLRVRPRLDFPLARLGLKPLIFYTENEFFFNFDFEDGRDTFSENRATIGANLQVLGPFGVTAAYRNVGKKSASTGSWDFTNVLFTSVRLSF